MFDHPSVTKSAIITVFSAALISAVSPPEEPGAGVLCLGTMIYFVEKNGKQCRAAEDPKFQARIASYSRRFDDYIIRNTGGDPALLEQFKDSQNLTSEDQDYICQGSVSRTYDHFKAANVDELDDAIDELLARDGPPTFDDCI